MILYNYKKKFYWHNNVIDKSSFEVSNYFQKVIYSISIATVHIFKDILN